MTQSAIERPEKAVAGKVIPFIVREGVAKNVVGDVLHKSRAVTVLAFGEGNKRRGSARGPSSAWSARLSLTQNVLEVARVHEKMARSISRGEERIPAFEITLRSCEAAKVGRG